MAEVRHHRAQQADPAGQLAEPPLAFVEGDRWLTPQKQSLGWINGLRKWTVLYIYIYIYI